MKRVVLVVFLVTVCVATVVLWVGYRSLNGPGRAALERELTRRTGTPCTVGNLDVSLIPLRIRLDAVTIGDDPALARIEAIDVRLAALSSIAEGRAVISVQIDSPAIDLSHPRKETPPAPKPAAPQPASPLRLPPIHLDAVELRQASLRFQMTDTPAELTVGRLNGWLKAGLLGAGFTAGLDLADVALQRKTYRAHFERIRADGGWNAGGLYVNTATLRGERLSGTLTAALTPNRHTADVTFDPGVLGVVVDELAVISGQAHVTGTLTGSLIDPVSHGHLAIVQGAIGTHVLGDLSTRVTHHRASLGFEDLRLTGAGGDVTGTVNLVVDNDVPINGELSWNGVDLHQMLAIIGPQIPFHTRFSATTSVLGIIDPLDLDVRGTGSLQAPHPEPLRELAAFTLGGRIRAHDLDANIELTQAQGNTVTARVLIEHDDFGGTVRVDASDLDALNALLPDPIPTLRLDGRGDGQATFGGTVDHPTVTGTLSLRDAHVSGTPVAHLSGDFFIARQVLRTNATTLQTAGGRIDVGGAIALDDEAANDFRAALQDLDTDLVLDTARGFTDLDAPVAGGLLNGIVTCRGPWLRPNLHAALTATALQVAGEPLEHVEIDLTAALPQWSGTLTATRSPTQTLHLSGGGDARGRFDLALQTTALDVSTLRAARPHRIAGTLTARGQFSGTAQNPGGTLEVAATDLVLGRYRLGALDLTATGTAGTWNLGGTAFERSVTLAGAVRATGPLPYTATVTWTDTDLAPMLDTGDALQVLTSGALQLAGHLREPQTSSGSVRVDRLAVRRDHAEVAAPEPMRIELDRGRFRILSLAMAAPDARMDVTGLGTLGGDLDLDVRGGGDLVLLEFLGDPIQSARGTFAIAAHLGHGAGGWELRGDASVRDAALDVGLPIAVTDTTGRFSLEGSQVSVDAFSGRAGGGEFTVGGSLDLDHGPALSWTAREVSLIPAESLEARVSGTGELRGTWRDLTVSGDIEILNALYDRRIELAGLIPFFRQQLAPAPRGPTGRELRLDLRLRAPDGLFVDNNFGKVELRCDLRLKGRAHAPRIVGLVEVLDGEVSFRNRLYEITGGAVEFKDTRRINPILNITAESQIHTTEAEYTVIVAVTGTADNPRVQLTADDPSLTQNDVLSLVTFGRPAGASQDTTGGTVGVGNVFALMPSEYTGDVHGRVRSIFGVDRFEIEPAYVRDTGTIEPRVTVGKDITQRVRALASSSFGAEARNSVQLEYRVTRRISLLGAWESGTSNDAGAVGGDIKFRYEFRKLPFSFLGAAAPPPRPDAP